MEESTPLTSFCASSLESASLIASTRCSSSRIRSASCTVDIVAASPSPRRPDVDRAPGTWLRPERMPHLPAPRGTRGPTAYTHSVDASARHLRLLTETIAAVNSTLDLEEVLELVASKVAEALDADACFVYLYDERADELVLRATHGTSVEEMTRRPRLRPGEGITGSAAAERAPIAIAARAHLDPRFKTFPN